MINKKEAFGWFAVIIMGLVAMFLWGSRFNSLETVIENQETIIATVARLESAASKGPRFTACDGKELVTDLRSQGIAIPKQPYEELCK